MPEPTGNVVVDWIAAVLFLVFTLAPAVRWALRPLTRAIHQAEQAYERVHELEERMRLHMDLTEYQAESLRQQGIQVPYVIPPTLRRATP